MKFDLLVEETLREFDNNLIVIFPGRFQPFHIGHKKLYDLAKQQFPGADFYVATADEIAKPSEPGRYPFNFKEKKEIIKAAGIPEKEIVLTRQPYKPLEILNKYDSNTAKVIYLIGKKDMETDPRFKFGLTKKGSPTYFQPFKNLTEMVPFKEDGGHGYIYAPMTIEFSIGGRNISSGTELRTLYKSANDQQRKKIVEQILGKFDVRIYNLFNKKLV